jgi:hypothetical protein
MSKLKEQKKKERERRSREKVLRRRKAIRAKSRKEREDAMEQRRVQKLANKVEGKTYVNRDALDQHALLQRNLEILEALDAQQREQQQQRQPVKEGVSAEVSFTPNQVPEDNS